MFRHPSNALLALVVAAASLLATGCTKPLPDQPDARLAVAATALVGPYQPGDNIAFRLTVTNVGNADVTRVSINSTLGADVYERSVTCSPLGLSATHAGDEECHDSVYILNLAKGASVTFDIAATLGAHAHGTITNTFTASVLSGPAAVVATNQAAIVDNRGGAYTAFTSDGYQLGVAADFVGDTLTFSGNGPDVAAPFTLPANGNAFRGAGNSGFLAHPDLLAGTAPLDGGTPVFIASRNFIASIAALDGRAFNTFEIDTPTGGAPASHFRTTQFSGSTMQACADLVPHTIATCPAASLRHYDLTLAGAVFTGVDAADADTVNFRVAQSNAALVLLRAEATAGGRVFQVGLSTNAGIDPNVLQGGDTAGRWGDIDLNDGNLQENWMAAAGSPLSEYNASLAALANAPPGVVASTAVSATTPVFLAEDGDLAILMGRPGSAADGLLQLFAF